MPPDNADGSREEFDFDIQDDQLLIDSVTLQEELHKLTSTNLKSSSKPVNPVFPKTTEPVNATSSFLELPPVIYPLSENPPCELCKNSIDYDEDLYGKFHILICRPCKQRHEEKFELLTKTDVKEIFLLTDDDLSFPKKLQFITKRNPRFPTWNPMCLYLRYQVEEVAIKKYGSLENIDLERETREEQQLKKKEKQFKSKLTELRRKTRIKENILTKTLSSSEEVHQHDFVDDDKDLTISKNSISSKKRCRICGLTAKVEDF